MQQKQVSIPIFTLIRLIIAAVFGLIVGGIALSSGHDAAKHSALVYQQGITQHDLFTLRREIEAYREKMHVLPKTLQNLKLGANTEQTNDDGVIAVGGQTIMPDGEIVDAWHRPFIYEVQGSRYRVISYGKDGKPGGKGLNADLTTDNPRPGVSRMTFAEFWTDPYTLGMRETACFSGLIAAILCFYLIRPAAVMREKLLGLILGLVALLVATVFVTSIITTLHVPSGH